MNLDQGLKVYNKDCMEVMKDYPDNYFDLAIVDPPYGIGMDNSNKRTKPSRPNSYTQYKDKRYHESNWDDNAPTKEYFEELFSQVGQVFLISDILLNIFLVN